MNPRIVITVVAWLLMVGHARGAQDLTAPTATPPAPPPAVTSPPPSQSDLNTDPSEYERWSSGRYRITASDVIDVTFPFVPEFNQVVTVQPDGYITLRSVGDLRVQGRSLPEFRIMLLDAYEPILREPSVTITIKEFEKPYFIASGEVKTPGKFELRGATTVTQALALAGGPTTTAKSSQVILFRRYSEELVEVKEVDVKKMLAKRELSEDYLLRPGDTLYVPKSFIAKIKPFIPAAGFYLNPLNPFGH